jgi:hypothetical protein
MLILLLIIVYFDGIRVGMSRVVKRVTQYYAEISGRTLCQYAVFAHEQR